MAFIYCICILSFSLKRLKAAHNTIIKSIFLILKPWVKLRNPPADAKIAEVLNSVGLGGESFSLVARSKN